MSNLQIGTSNAVSNMNINQLTAKKEKLGDNRPIETSYQRRDYFENINEDDYIRPPPVGYTNTSAPYASSSIYKESNFYSTTVSKTQMACNIAGLACEPWGEPIFNSAQDYNEFNKAKKYIDDFTPISVYNSYDGSSSGVTKTIYTQDHQYFLYALTDKYDSAAKNYYTYHGYNIDAYLIMGIGFGESNASQTSSNPFGAVSSLSTASVNKATNRAVRALQDCGLAANQTEAKNMMASDPFYQKAAEVLSYLDNGFNYKLDPMKVYSTFDQANQNAERWRTAVENKTQDFSYIYYR